MICAAKFKATSITSKNADAAFCSIGVFHFMDTRFFLFENDFIVAEREHLHRFHHTPWCDSIFLEIAPPRPSARR